MGICCDSNSQSRGEDKGANGLSQQMVGATITSDALDQLNLTDDLTQKLILSISCIDLPNLDKKSKSDPFVVIWEHSNGQKVLIGQTECILDNMNPQFVNSIDVNFRFEENQTFEVQVYDVDDMSQINNLSKQQFIGGSQFTLHNVITKPQQTASLKLVNPKMTKNGQVKIQAVEKRADFGQTECQFNVVVSNSQKFSNYSLFFMLFQKNSSTGQMKPVYKSENQKCLKGVFTFGRVFSDTDRLANSIDNEEITFKFYQYSASGNHKVVYSQVTNLANLKMAAAQQTPVIIKNSFDVSLQQIIIQKRVSFLDYIFGGCEISLQVAVDFTASNGDVNNPRSLHYMNPQGHPNQYQHAIMTVGSILEEYDTDKKYPLYGFGGKLQENSQTSHCFAMNGDILKPDCHGVQGLLDTYKSSIYKVPLSGPTYFSPIIEYVNGYCRHKLQEMSQNNQQYTIMLILTDGAIMDMQQTIDSIVAASKLPLSIVIVGVGSANFETMHQLDADEAPLFSHKSQEYNWRDIVQFVPYLKFQSSPALLAREVLREIPGQLVKYFQTMRFVPNAPITDQMISAPLNTQDSYFDELKASLIGQAVNAGMSPDQAEAFLNHIGLAEYNVQSLLHLANKANYSNNLKVDQQQ